MRHLVAAVAAFVVTIVMGSASAPARDDGGGGSGRSGGDGREGPADRQTLDHIPLIAPNGGETRVGRLIIGNQDRQILIETRLIEQTNVDKLDLSVLPLFGSLVGPEFRADDMTDANEVGRAYHTGDGGLFLAVRPNTVALLATPRVVVFNRTFSYEPLGNQVVLNENLVLPQLGELGPLISVRSVLSASGPQDDRMLVLGSLQAAEAGPRGTIPVLHDIPILKRLFAGTVHQSRNNALLVLVRPSIIAGDR